MKPDASEWVTFARRPGRFGVAIPLDARPPIWFATKPDRHFFGHGGFSCQVTVGDRTHFFEQSHNGALDRIAFFS